MSEIFEGVVLPSSGIHEAVGADSALALAARRIGHDAVALFREGPRSEAGFTEAIDELAARLSRMHGKALLVRYDSRIGHRSSTLYERGEKAVGFGRDDELYVPLDDQGEPALESPPLTLDHFDPGMEYETVENAIQLGLRALGVDAWDSLFELMTA